MRLGRECGQRKGGLSLSLLWPRQLPQWGATSRCPPEPRILNPTPSAFPLGGSREPHSSAFAACCSDSKADFRSKQEPRGSGVRISAVGSQAERTRVVGPSGRGRGASSLCCTQHMSPCPRVIHHADKLVNKRCSVLPP